MRKLSFALLTIALILTIATPSFAAPKVVLSHVYTWDADMINADLVHQEGHTGKGVYVAVLDTGLTPNWRDYFSTQRIATNLGIGFYENVQLQGTCDDNIILKTDGILHKTSFIGSVESTHGTHVVSTIIGYNYCAPADAAAGLPLPPVYVEGIAPDVTIIPVKVLSDYHFKGCPDGLNFGTDNMVAAGIRYAADLKLAGYAPMIVTMSLGGPEPTPVIEDAINYAITNGVIVVAAAGNSGTQGMDWPGAYPQVISVGASGWKYEWYWSNYVTPPPRNRLWWLQSSYYPYNDIPESASDLTQQVYITDFSGIQVNPTGFSNCGINHDQACVQQLDVIAPGSWVRGPFPGVPGYSHLPWWSDGLGWFRGHNPGNFYYLGGTSMATPHVTSVVALMLQKDSTLTQIGVETILKSTALPIPAGSMTVWDLTPTQGWYTYSWESDATGAGLVQADAAVNAA